MLLCLVLLQLGSSKQSPASYFYNTKRPLIIAHRGACGYLPEHTLQSYDIARYMGADFIEPDLVPTRDRHLLINHEGLLNDTTNVAELPQYSYLHTTKTFNTSSGMVTETGWFAEDFYLYQIKQLKAKQRLSFRPQTMNYYFNKITINEALDWVININQDRIINNQTLLGAYIELKNPSYYNSIGIHVEDLLLEILRERSIDTIKGASAICPIILQCFELQSLEYMSKYTDLPLVFLISENSNSYNMSQYMNIVNGVGPDVSLVFNQNGSPTDFVQKSHESNLAVHMWVVRDDVPFDGFQRQQMYEAVQNAEVDGIFDEFPDSASVYFTYQSQSDFK